MKDIQGKERNLQDLLANKKIYNSVLSTGISMGAQTG